MTSTGDLAPKGSQHYWRQDWIQSRILTAWHAMAHSRLAGCHWPPYAILHHLLRLLGRDEVGSDWMSVAERIAMREQIEAIIHEARSARTKGQAAEARRRYGDAARLAGSAGDQTLLAHALRHLSELDLEDGSSEAAFAAGNEAVTLLNAEPTAGSLDLANALRVTALALEALARPSEAAVRWHEARQLYAAFGVLEGVAECDLHLERPH